MIKSITLTNFQSHKNTFIEFCNGTNALVGLSDSGKTAILRALTWVIKNSPSGDSFRSSWGGDTKVQVELSDGTVVERGRTNSDNYYEIQVVGKPVQAFRAFGQGTPPKEIVELFNMSEINMSAQMDAPFLLSAGPGEVAQILNRVVQLDVIDQATSNANKKKLDAGRNLKTCEARLSQLQEQLKSFEYIDAMENDVARYEDLVTEHSNVKLKIQSIRSKIDQYTKFQDRQQKYHAILAAELPLQTAVELLRKSIAASKQINLLSSVISQINDKSNMLEKKQKIVPASQQVLAAIALVDKQKELNARIVKLLQLTTKIETRQDMIKSAKENIVNLEAEFHSMMPDICPLCGNSTNSIT